MATEKAGSSESTVGSFRTIDVSRLRVGNQLKFPIKDDNDVLLLAEGLMVTASFLDQLKNRGILSISVHESEVPRICAGDPQGTGSEAIADREGVVCSLRNEETERLDDIVRLGQLGLPAQGTAFATVVEQHGAASHSDTLKDEMAGRRNIETNQIKEVFEGLSSGRGLDVTTLNAITESNLDDMAKDADLFARIGINPFAEGYPARHSLHVSMLAIVLGTHLQLDRQTVKDLSIGCLIHDSGMTRLDKRLYTTSKSLDMIDFLEISKHPVIIFDVIKDAHSLSNRSTMIAYQMHERCNGSGYPRRRLSARIHFLSKLAAVADAYVGLVSPRPHRAGLLPYHAMAHMLKSVPAGLYDPIAVKALLHAVSLFPIGSYVELNDGRVGRVLRTLGDAYTRPVVEVWKPGELQAAADILDLNQERELHVVRPRLSLASA